MMDGDQLHRHVVMPDRYTFVVRAAFSWGGAFGPPEETMAEAWPHPKKDSAPDLWSGCTPDDRVNTHTLALLCMFCWVDAI